MEATTVPEIDQHARRIWDYMRLDQEVRPAENIFTPCSFDDRVAVHAAELLLDGYGDRLIFASGTANHNDLVDTGWEESELEHFVKVAVETGVPEDRIIREDRSRNAGENIRFTHDLMKGMALPMNSLVIVQKPYMERRTYATFVKQWPEPATDFTITSPALDYENYFNEQNPKDPIIAVMVGDLQRIREYPKLGFQIEQAIPDDVWASYEALVDMGYDSHLL